MTDKISEEFKNSYKQNSFGDLGSGEDVSNCVAFLASDLSSMNGETIMAECICLDNLLLI